MLMKVKLVEAIYVCKSKQKDISIRQVLDNPIVTSNKLVRSSKTTYKLHKLALRIKANRTGKIDTSLAIGTAGYEYVLNLSNQTFNGFLNLWLLYLKIQPTHRVTEPIPLT